MKKVLSFVLVLAMILGCTAMAFAVTPATDKEKADAVAVFADAPNSKVATILKDLGVLAGDENGNANLENPITRAELCTVLMRALGYGKVASKQVTTVFTDVPKTHWASGYINYAYTLGKVGGRSAKLFAPDEEVTGNEAVAFIMKALGYSDEHLDGTWPSNFVVLAGTEGVLGEFAPSDEAATREEVFTLLYNALDVRTAKWSNRDEEYNYNYVNTIAYTLGVKSMDSSDLYFTTEVAVKEGGKLANKFDMTPYVGKNVEVLYKLNDSDPEKMTVVKVVSTELVGEFTSAGKFKTADKTYAVTAGTAGAMKLENGVSKGAVEAFSGKATLQAKLSKDGKITTIYSVDTAKSAKYILTKSDADQFAALYTNKVKKSSVTMLGATITVTKSGIYYVPVETSFEVEGDVDSLKDVAENDVVEVVLASTPKFIVTRDVVEDVVPTRIKGVEYTFDNGATYKYASATASDTVTPDAVAIASETAFTLYLDKDGKIFKSEKYLGGKKALTYAFVLDTYEDETSTGWASDEAKGVKKVMLFNFDGSVATYEFNLKKCTPLTTAGFTTGAIVTYHVTDEKIDVFTLAALTNNTYDVKVGASYATINTTSYHYADDVEVVMMAKQTSDLKLTDEKYYTVKTVADLAGKTWNKASTYYLIDANDEVAKLVVQDLEYAAATSDIATMYAFAVVEGKDAKGSYISVLGPDVEDDLYRGASFTQVVTANGFYQFILTDGKITAVNEIPSAQVLKATTSAVALAPVVELDGDLIKVDGKQAGLADDYVIYTWNATDKVYEEVGEIEDLYSACEIKLVNIKVDAKKNLTELVDVIILKLAEEE